MSARRRHSPIRTCVGCRVSAPKETLLRVVRCPDGAVRVDPTGKINGRGAYLCRRAECVLAAKKKNALSHALRMSIPDDLWDLLEQVSSEGRVDM